MGRPGILTEGVSILAGKPKMGKSWMGLNLAVCVACGGVALGKEQVQSGDVLYLALEDTKRRLQDRLCQLLGGEPAPVGLTLATAWRRLDEGGLEDLGLWLAAHPGARLVVIDTLAKVRPLHRRQENSYEADYQSLSGLKELADRHGVVILVIHHLRKLDAVDPVDAVSGTLGLTGAADGVLVLKRDRGRHDAVLFVTGRDVDEQELALQWDERLACWTIVGSADDYRLSKERAELLRLFEREGGRALGPTEAADLLGRKVGAVKKLLWDMAKAGQLGTEGGKYWAWKSSNPGNSGDFGNSGNLGNRTSEAKEVTEVTAAEVDAVTAQGALQGGEVPLSYRVTEVTAGRRGGATAWVKVVE